jgi:hypothetical protein
MSVFWVIAPCILAEVDRPSPLAVQLTVFPHLIVTPFPIGPAKSLPCQTDCDISIRLFASVLFIPQMMAVVRASETSIFETKRHLIPEGCRLQNILRPQTYIIKFERPRIGLVDILCNDCMSASTLWDISVMLTFVYCYYSWFHRTVVALLVLIS